MTISKQQIEQVINLKKLYCKKLSELTAGDSPFIGTVLPDNAERVIDQTAEVESSKEAQRLKRFLAGLSEEALRELQAIAFYGRGEYKKFALAAEEAAQMVENAADIHYTMQLLAAGDYLEAGLDKLKRRHEA